MNEWQDIDLRPLSLGELLDRTFVLYRRRFALFTGILLIPQLVMLAVALGLQVMLQPINTAAGGGQALPANFPSTVFLGGGVTGILYLVVYSVVLGATTYAMSDVYLNRAVSIGGAYRKLGGQWARLVGLVVVMIVFLFLLFFLFVFAGALIAGALAVVSPTAAGVGAVLAFLGGFALAIWATLRYWLSVPALVLERTGVFNALSRSARLTAGIRGSVFVTLLLIAILHYNTLTLFQGPFSGLILGMQLKHGVVPLWLSASAAVTGSISSVLSGPFLMIALSLLYYDARVRKEALDLRLLLAKVDAESSPPQAASPAGAPRTLFG